jgi:tRNA1(Val) A37 N6-methylase TrmN6
MNIVKLVLDLIAVDPEGIVVDLGYGGSVVIEAAKRGAKALCIEIDEDMIKLAYRNVQQLNLIDRILSINKDIFKVDVSRTTIVYVFNNEYSKQVEGLDA